MDAGNRAVLVKGEEEEEIEPDADKRRSDGGECLLGSRSVPPSRYGPSSLFVSTRGRFEFLEESSCLSELGGLDMYFVVIAAQSAALMDIVSRCGFSPALTFNTRTVRMRPPWRKASICRKIV